MSTPLEKMLYDRIIYLRTADALAHGIDPDLATGEERRYIRQRTLPFSTLLPWEVPPPWAANPAKAPLHLLEPRANEQIALALAHGAEKYNRRDYMRTDDHRLPMSDYVGRLRRHIDAWDSGEDTDPDSGLSHIAHIGANAHVLLSGASFADDRNSTP